MNAAYKHVMYWVSVKVQTRSESFLDVKKVYLKAKRKINNTLILKKSKKTNKQTTKNQPQNWELSLF